jgi:4-hydroxy-3-methylbut-2-en-1-yl diphosphate synthase IspG/GcpE
LLRLSGVRKFLVFYVACSHCGVTESAYLKTN